MVERDRWAAWLDPPRPSKDDLLGLLVPAAPGRARGLPGLDRRSATCATTAPSWSSRCRSRTCPLDVVDVTLPRTDDASCVDTPHGEGRLVTDRARRPIATLLLGHGAGGGIETPRPRRRWPATCRATASPWSASSSRGGVAGRKVATAPPTLDAALRGRRRPAARPHAARSSAAAPPAPGPPPDGGAGSAPPAAWRWRSRCTRPAGRRSPGSTSCSAPGCRTLVVQGEHDPFGRPEEFPDDVEH